MTPDRSVGSLESALRGRREGGGKALVPYLTGGLGEWRRTLEAVADAGVDGIEVGIPFSDPVMDGPVIQDASQRALEQGATPASILTELSELDLGVPVAVMTYYNLVYRYGLERFANELAVAGVAGAILPDLPLDEAGPWLEAAAAAEREPVLLAAPTSPPERLEAICERSRGFVYGVGLLGVTGERDALASTAKEVAARLKATTDVPVLVGVGVSTPEQAVEVCEVADGVVVGSAVVRRILEGGTPEQVAALVGEFRQALDRAWPTA
ncbi:MAG: tryptophan synthase subunit alpha [Actinomycetota bacterium]